MCIAKLSKTLVFCLVLLVFCMGCNDKVNRDVETGEASFYSDKYQGRSTASGDIYDKTKFTAAHRSLPFGTMLDVFDLQGNHVVVIINDRLLSREPERIIDLSRAAAEKLDMIDAGIKQVKISKYKVKK